MRQFAIVAMMLTPFRREILEAPSRGGACN